MKYRVFSLILGLFLGSFAAFGACSEPENPASPTPTFGPPTPTFTVTAPTPTPETTTPVPTASVRPSEVPTATPTPEPTPEPPLPPPPPPAASPLAIDVSNYWTPDPVSDAQAVEFMQSFADAGYNTLIAGTQIPSVTYQQLSAARLVGLDTELYVELSTRSNFAAEMARALYASEGIPISRTWIAFEVPVPAGISAEDWIDAALTEAINAGLPNVGIYSANWWWSAWVHDSARFADWPLWYAYYDGRATMNWSREHFGAWAVPTWKQFAGSVTQLEHVADLVVATYGFVPDLVPLSAAEASGPPNVDLNVGP